MKTKNIFRMLLVAAALLMGANNVKATETNIGSNLPANGTITIGNEWFTDVEEDWILRIYLTITDEYNWELLVLPNGHFLSQYGEFKNWAGSFYGADQADQTRWNGYNDYSNGYMQFTIGAEGATHLAGGGLILKAKGMNISRVTLEAPEGGGTQTGPVDVTLSFNPSSLSIKYGQTVTPTITATADNTTVTDLTYTYASDDSDIATVNDAGAVTGVGIGSTTITVSWAAIPSYYTAGSATYNVTVGKADASISFSNNVELIFGQTFTPPTVTSTPANATVTYTTSDANIVYQKANGSLVPVGEGTATITGSFAESTNYTAASGTYTIKVNRPTREGAAWTGAAWLGNYAQYPDNDQTKPRVGTQPDIPTKSFSSANVGDAIRFYGKLGPLSDTYWRVETHGNNWAQLDETEGNDGFANGYFDMAITNENINILQSSSNLTLNGYNLTITAAELIPASAPAKQNVTLAFSPTSATATMGESFTEPTLTATSNGQTVTLTGITYSSSNTSVATVDSNGEVTLVAAGTTVITASFSGNDNYNAATASYTLTVNAAPEYINVNDAKIGVNGYRTYVTSHAVDLSGSINVEAYYATGLNSAGTDVEFTQVTGVCAIGVPLLLKATVTGATEYKLLKSSAVGTTPTGNKLQPGQGSEVSGANKYVLTKHSGQVVFAEVNIEGATVGTEYAYLDLSGSNANGRLRIKLNGESTGISTIESNERSLDGAVYNLRGQRVEHPTKGLYIINGKKVVIK